MPSYPLTIPDEKDIRSVTVRKRNAVAVFENPHTLQSQVQETRAARYEIDVTLQQLTTARAAAWVQFLHDLQGQYGTFQFDLAKWSPVSPAAGTKTFRLASNAAEWSVTLATQYSITFSAVEVI